VSKYPGKNHDPELQNTAFYIEGGSGEMTGKFIKRNLWHPERWVFAMTSPDKAGHISLPDRSSIKCSTRNGASVDS